MLTFYNFLFPERRNITYSCTDIDVPASASFHRAPDSTCTPKSIKPIS